jgi:hypothetical protein
MREHFLGKLGNLEAQPSQLAADGHCLPSLSDRRVGGPSPLRRLDPPKRGGSIKSNRLSKIQELQNAHAVLATLDSTDKRLTAPDPIGHLLLAQVGPLAAFLKQMPQDLMPRRSKLPHRR